MQEVTRTGIGLSIVKNIFEMHGFKCKILLDEGKFVIEIQVEGGIF